MSDDSEPTTGTRSISRRDVICGFAVGCLVSVYAVLHLRHRTLLIYQMNLPCYTVLISYRHQCLASMFASQTKVYCKRVGQLCVKTCTNVISHSSRRNSAPLPLGFSTSTSNPPVINRLWKWHHIEQFINGTGTRYNSVGIATTSTSNKGCKS